MGKIQGLGLGEMKSWETQFLNEAGKRKGLCKGCPELELGEEMGPRSLRMSSRVLTSLTTVGNSTISDSFLRLMP